MRPDDSLKPFSQELRRWARRDLKASASVARSRLLNALESSPPEAAARSSRVWPRLMPALAVVVLAVVLVFLILPGAPEIPVVDPPSLDTPNLDGPRTDRFLVVTLTSGNPLYIQLTPARSNNLAKQPGIQGSPTMKTRSSQP